MDGETWLSFNLMKDWTSYMQLTEVTSADFGQNNGSVRDQLENSKAIGSITMEGCTKSVSVDRCYSVMQIYRYKYIRK